MTRLFLTVVLTTTALGQGVAAQANCAGLSKAQCRFVTIVGTCSFGDGHLVQDGRVTINGKLVGEVNSVGEIVDESGKIVTELTAIYQKTCRE